MSSDDRQELMIYFEDLDAAEAGVRAAGLREALLDASPGVTVDLHKADPGTMDMGATLLLVLGTPAILAIAKGAAAFIARERTGTLVIERKGRGGSTVVFKGNSSDAAKIAAALTQA